MVKQDLFEGLKAAVQRGESLSQAVQSFQNAGYNSQDVQEAARALQSGNIPAPQTQQPVPTTQIKKPQTRPQKLPPQPIVQKRQTKKISSYQQKPKKGFFKSWILILILAIVLILLIGVLTGVILFKEELIGFFDKLAY